MPTSLAEPFWLSTDDAIAIHAEQLKLHGGPEGILDYGLVASAVHRPQQMYNIGGERDVLTLAIRLGIGIAANHGFVDGNKRTGAFAMIEFLALNGAWLEMPNDTRLARLFLLTLSRRMQEEDLADALFKYLVFAD